MKRTLIFLIILYSSIALFADLTQGLISHYPLNGNAKDTLGNNKDLLVYGATLTEDRDGIGNNAFFCDGKNDYLSTTNNFIFGRDIQTICFWVYIYSSSKNTGIISVGKSSPSWAFYGGFNKKEKKISFRTYDGRVTGRIKSKRNSFNTDKWNFVCIIKSTSQIFINGNDVTDHSETSSPNDIDGHSGKGYRFKIGTGSKSGDNYSKCKIDDIRFYNRALSRNEVSILYSANDNNTFTKQEKQSFPPDLYIENLKFHEPSNNKALDGLETGSIKFDIVNKGRGNANNIEIDITPLTSSKNLSFKSKTKVAKVLSKDRTKISIPITADIDVDDLFREFRIEVTESNGFDTDPATISFETLAFASPDLRIEQIAIDDNEDAEGEGFSYGNGNSTIEPNESIEVTAYVQNFGEGSATNVKAKIVLNSSNRDITYPDEGKIFNLGDIESGAYRKVEFYFYTSRRYDDENIPLSIMITENTGKFGKNSDLGLKLGNRTKNIVDVQVSTIHKKKKTKMKELDNIVVLSDVDKNIPETNIDGKNTLAIIIGIEDYKYAPTVDFASNDARVFYQYSKSVFGIPERNIYYRINDGATSGEFNKIFADDGWISRRLKKDQTDVIVYYSGHGAPDTKSEKGYLIPHDIDPNYASTGVSLDFIYSSLSKLQANSVTLFIDACFSGESRSKEMLIAGIRPISVKIKNPILTTENMAVFSASRGEQYSSAYPKKQHGLFTYFLLKGLKGKAKGSDKKITLDELQQYIYENVSQTAGYLDKEQNPTFISKDKTRVLLKYWLEN